MKTKVTLGLRVKERNNYFQMYKIEQDGRLIEKPFKCTKNDIIRAYNERCLSINMPNLMLFLYEPKDLMFSAFKLRRYV